MTFSEQFHLHFRSYNNPHYPICQFSWGEFSVPSIQWVVPWLSNSLLSRSGGTFSSWTLRLSAISLVFVLEHYPKSLFVGSVVTVGFSLSQRSQKISKPRKGGTNLFSEDVCFLISLVIFVTWHAHQFFPDNALQVVLAIFYMLSFENLKKSADL